MHEAVQSGTKGRVFAMSKSISCIAAALLAAAICALSGPSPQVHASTLALAGKADRLDARPLGGACSQREWPYFETTCLRDARNPSGKASEVRIVSIDRLPQ